MSIYQLTQIECDNCHDVVDLYMPVPAAKREATADGWKIGRSPERDLCEECKGLFPSEDA